MSSEQNDEECDLPAGRRNEDHQGTEAGNKKFVLIKYSDG
jgi:hypothetical protein